MVKLDRKPGTTFNGSQGLTCTLQRAVLEVLNSVLTYMKMSERNMDGFGLDLSVSQSSTVLF